MLEFCGDELTCPDESNDPVGDTTQQVSVESAGIDGLGKRFPLDS